MTFQRGYADHVDRTCPFLALESDMRSAMAGYDPDHRCRAMEEPITLDRATQVERCLSEAHTRCPRFLARTEKMAAGQRPSLRPAPDARFVSTRLVLESDDAWRPVSLAVRPMRRTRAVLTGATLLVVGASGAALSTRGFGLMSPASQPTSAPTTTPTAATPGRTTQPTPSPSVPPTPKASVAVAIPTPRPATATPRPTARLYVVQRGDSLSAIAQRYGVSVQAIMAANGLANANLVNVGQVLIIPS